MLIRGPLLQGRFIQRYKRFLMDIRLDDGKIFTVHCPNTGSMEGCLEEDALVLASPGKNPKRKLSHTAEWIRLSTGWVGINTHRSNQIVAEALLQRSILSLEQYTQVRREVPIGNSSRVDFMLTGPGLPPCYVEVKNTTWPTPDGGIGFPDAVTERGLRHLEELKRLKRQGARAVMFYLINREGGTFFRPSFEKDAVYAKALKKVSKEGVEVLACRAHIDPPQVYVSEKVPYTLDLPQDGELINGQAFDHTLHSSR